jgi:ABC-2 type transport system ATP-binding protein
MAETLAAPDSAVHEFLEVQTFTKHYGRLTAIDGVSFSIRRGEILGLIGPNGSGKTTLFECLGGTRFPDAGTILQNGRPITTAERKKLMFYLPDRIAPWPAQQVRWAIDFCLGLFGGRVGLRDDVIRRMDLVRLLDRPMGKLSTGQLKRALLAIGLLMPQPLLIADEPFEGLDLRQTREIASALRHYASVESRTMLLSIHQIKDAARVCDRFALLSDGKIRGEGTLNELSALAAARGRAPANPDLEEVFLALT